MILTPRQMTMMGRLNLEFIGWQHGASGKVYILANDRDNGNATYSFDHNASADDIMEHVVQKREEFASYHTTTPGEKP